MAEGSVGEERLVGRRDLLAATTAIVGSSALATAGIASASQDRDDKSYVAASVSGHPSSKVIEVVPFGTDITVRVQLAEGAIAVHRDNSDARFADFVAGTSIVFDLPGGSGEHRTFDTPDDGKLFTASHVADCLTGAKDSRGRSVN